MEEKPGQEQIRVLTGTFDKMRGLLRRSAQWYNTLAYAVLVPCNDIHTYGMQFDIDVAFVDEHGMVLEAYRQVTHSRRIRVPGACMVLERPARGGPWFRQDQCVLRTPKAYEPPVVKRNRKTFDPNQILQFPDLGDIPS